MKTTAEYIHLLKHYLSENGAKYGIPVWGFLARWQENSKMRIVMWISVMRAYPPSLLTLSKIQEELEDLLGCPVDMVRIRDNMNRYLKERINREVIDTIISDIEKR